MKKLIFILVFGITIITSLAQNLVPNPSFEERNGCPSAIGEFNFLNDWIRPNWGSSDYFNVCDSSNIVGVPINAAGIQTAHNGYAYIGIATYHWATREYIQAELINALVSQKKYIVEFYVSLPDSCNYASNEMGAYVSINAPSNTTGSPFEVNPQVSNNLIDSLNDKINWMKISGEFYALGGEKYITIGNFKSNATTDVYEAPEGGVTWTEELAYYYIDDVSVTLDTTTGVNEFDGTTFRIYPNPAKNNFSIETDFAKKSVLKLYDISGRLVFTQFLQTTKTSLDISNLLQGVYVVVLEQEGKLPSRKKMIIEK